MPKVIGTDNWGRDYNGGRDETVKAENLTQEEAEQLCKKLNLNVYDTYYVVKSDDYVPYKFEGY